jgi:hypothetical protein
MTDRKLSDIEAHDRIIAAAEALGDAEGETQRADTALIAARRALALISYGLVAAMEKAEPTDR